MKIRYQDHRFSDRSAGVIVQADAIIAEYLEQGFDLTLRQLYYQMVARDLIPNKQREYKRLGTIISNARMAGYIDWSAIVDRTRELRSRSHWDTPAEIIEAAADAFAVDMWSFQDYRVEVWIEKDALIGVIAGVCDEFDAPYFSCRGYTSQSEMWAAGQRLIENHQNGYETIILHLGDHDPSGIDMSRDILDRLNVFAGDDDARFSVRRIALNTDQVHQYDPPPNPAKLTDSRVHKYIAQHGYESWELDALEPQVLVELIRQHIEEFIDPDLWEERRQEQERGRAELNGLSEHL